MKTIYFIRHGEAEVNVGKTFGAEDTPLTEKGREQARAVAERCAKLSVDLVIASTMARAQETASFVAQRKGMSVLSSELFEERHRPTSLYGKSRNDAEAERLHVRWIDTFFREGATVENGDNFSTLKERAGKILSFLESRSEEKILIVMHGFMLRTLLARIIFGTTLSPEELYLVIRTFHMSNTGITEVIFSPEDVSERPYPRGAWRVVSWNDQAHLG